MKCKLFGKTAVLMMMLTLCLLFAPAASAAETTGSSGSHTYYNDSFKLPADVTNIEEEAFYGCAGMTGIVIPGTVNSIGRAAFHGCSSLTDVYYHGTREQWNALSIGTDNLPLQRAEIHFVVDADNLANLTWVLDDTEKLTISGTGEMPDFDHPKTVGYHGQWFPYLDRILTVHIGDGVKSIGQYAFCYCENLVSVTIPTSVTRIGNAAFNTCVSLQSITIPSSVTSIGDHTFRYCHSLQSVMIPTSVTSIGDGAFSVCTSLENITIPTSVTRIGNAAFDQCESLQSITIPSSVTSIGDSAFDGCSALTSVTIPSSVTSIGMDAFCNCSGLTRVTIPESVTSIGRAAFHGCSGLTSVTIPSSVTSIGMDAFCNCSGLTTAGPIGSGCNYEFGWKSEIPGCAFDGCSGLTSVTIPSSVTSIGDDAFEDCSGLTSVTIPSSVKSIGAHAFDGCSALTSVTIPDSVTSIGVGTFSLCSALESVTIPSSVKSIGYEAFNNCESLKSIMIPSSVTSIGDRAFNSCPLQFVYYGGTQEQWQGIEIGENNNALSTVALRTVDQTFEILSFTCNPTDGRVTGTTSGGTIPNQFTLTVTASEDNLTYTWKWRENGASAWQAIESAPMYRVNDAHSNWIQFLTEDSSLNGHIYEFKCTVSKGYLNVDTSIVNIYVVNPDGTTPAAPVITKHPESITTSGSTAVFKVTATGSSLSYQWQYRESASGSWKNASDTGSKTAQLTVNVTNSKNGYQYRCAVSNASDTVNSNPATLTVRPEGTAPVVESIESDYETVTGTTGYHLNIPNQFTITVTATGDNLTYSWKWREKGTSTWQNITSIQKIFVWGGTNLNTLELHTEDPSLNGHSYQFKCVVSNDGGSTDSGVVTVDVVPIPDGPIL